MHHQRMMKSVRSATVNSSRVKAEVDGSRVTLKGTVRSIAEKEDAENAAWFAPGVTSVVNKIELKYLDMSLKKSEFLKMRFGTNRNHFLLNLKINFDGDAIPDLTNRIVVTIFFFFD